MTEVERAIAQIADIRSQLAASTRFRGYAPEAVGVLAIVSMAIVLAQLAWPAALATNDWQIAAAWGTLLAASGLIMAVEAFLRTRSEHGGMAKAMLQSALRAALPVTLVGAVMGGAVFTFAPQVCWMLPGLWQMMVGIVVIASIPTMPRAIVWPGIWYLAAGGCVVVLAGMEGAIDPLLAGGPFVIGHGAIALILREKGGRHGA